MIVKLVTFLSQVPGQHDLNYKVLLYPSCVAILLRCITSSATENLITRQIRLNDLTAMKHEVSLEVFKVQDIRSFIV